LTASDQVLIKGKKKHTPRTSVEFVADKMNVYSGFEQSPILGFVALIIMSPRLALVSTTYVFFGLKDEKKL